MTTSPRISTGAAPVSPTSGSPYSGSGGGGLDHHSTSPSSICPSWKSSSSSNNNNMRRRTTVAFFMIGCTLHIFGILLGFMLGSLNEQSNYIMKMEKDIATLVGYETTTTSSSEITTITPSTTIAKETIIKEDGHGVGIRGGGAAVVVMNPSSPDKSSVKKTYGLSYLRCNESVDHWIHSIPPHWNVTIWEKCSKESADDALSVQLKPDQREYEAIGAHLMYIMENYDNLPDVVVFSRNGELVRQRSQDDTEEDEDAICPPTPYYTLQEIQDDLDMHLKGYLHLGAQYPMAEKLYGEPYHGNFSLPSLDCMLPNVDVKMFQDLPYIPAIHFVPGGTFAVTKERIRHLALVQYEKLSTYITTPPDYELPRFIKKKSAAVDRLAQVLFGETFMLPPHAYARSFRNNIDKHGCPGQKKLGDRYKLEEKFVGGPKEKKETPEEQRKRRCGENRPKLSDKIEAISLKSPLNSTTTAVPYYGMSIVRCDEESEWIKSIKKDWGLVVWEKCNQNFDSRFSARSRHGVGGEDLSAHMKYIIRHYDNLPNVSIFMQADGLMGYEQIGRKCPHTPYCTLDDLQNDVEQHLDGFFNLGATSPADEDLFDAPYHGVHSLEVLEMVVQPSEIDIQALHLNHTTTTAKDVVEEEEGYYHSGKPKVRFVLGSHFAVTRERILHHSVETYQKLYDFIFKDEPVDANARRRACTLERLIHVLFGEPIIMPEGKYSRSFRNETEGCQQVEIRFMKKKKKQQ